MNMLSVSLGERFCAASRCLDFQSGGCAAAPIFLLLAQKKDGKEKGTLLTRPAAALRPCRRCPRQALANSLRSNTPRLFPVRDCDARRVRRAFCRTIQFLLIFKHCHCEGAPATVAISNIEIATPCCAKFAMTRQKKAYGPTTATYAQPSGAGQTGVKRPYV
jgi:hypothetical protein